MHFFRSWRTFRQNDFGRKDLSSRDIFTKNFTKIDQETAEKIANKTKKNNNTNKKNNKQEETVE